MCCKNCIRRRLSDVSEDSKIRLYTYGEPIDLTFQCIKHGCIVGMICKSPVYINYKKVLGFSILVEDEWITIAPGQSYPLPLEPQKVCKIVFDVKTNTGETSIIALTYDGYIIHSDNNITNIPKTQIWNLNAAYPISHLSLVNKGSDTIYIRNLTTE